jgi:hypothetical protein
MRNTTAIARRRLLAAAAGAAAGGAALLLVAAWGDPSRTDLGGLCLARSPLHVLAAPGRPCQRLALNLVTLPYVTGFALLVPRLPGRLAVRLAHVLAAAAPAAVLAAILAARPALLSDASALLGLGVLAAALLTGVLHLARPRPAHAAHLALAALWLALTAGSNLVVSLSAR